MENFKQVTHGRPITQLLEMIGLLASITTQNNQTPVSSLITHKPMIETSISAYYVVNTYQVFLVENTLLIS